MLTEKLTPDMTVQLRSEAGSAGDTDMVSLCDAALCGDVDAADAVAAVVTRARAMDGSRLFVRVVAI